MNLQVLPVGSRCCLVASRVQKLESVFRSPILTIVVDWGMHWGSPLMQSQYRPMSRAPSKSQHPEIKIPPRKPTVNATQHGALKQVCLLIARIQL